MSPQVSRIDFSTDTDCGVSIMAEGDIFNTGRVNQFLLFIIPFLTNIYIEF